MSKIIIRNDLTHPYINTCSGCNKSVNGQPVAIHPCYGIVQHAMHVNCFRKDLRDSINLR